ncbi:MAG TPA: hypothetical protein VGA94_01730 [Thermodesulfobacteriota bacterium]
MEENNTNQENKTNKVIVKHGGAAGGGMVYILGVVGAAVFYIQQAGGDVGQIVFGVLKALVWPAFLVYYALQFLQM